MALLMSSFSFCDLILSLNNIALLETFWAHSTQSLQVLYTVMSASVYLYMYTLQY